MYLKWIVCNVKKEKIREFSVAQQKWDQLSTAEGFINSKKDKLFGKLGEWVQYCRSQ